VHQREERNESPADPADGRFEAIADDRHVSRPERVERSATEPRRSQPTSKSCSRPPVRGCAAQAWWFRVTPRPGLVGRPKHPSSAATSGGASTRSCTHGSAKSLKCSSTL